MNINAEKLEIVKMILETDNPSILESIKKIFNRTNKTDFWETISQEQKMEILKGIEEIDKGQVIDYDAFIEKHK